MKLDSRAAAASRRRATQPGVVAGTLLALFSTFAVAIAGGPSGSGLPGQGGGGTPGNTPPGGLADDESIGSLPMLGGGFHFLPQAPSAGRDRPSAFVEGPRGRLLRALLDASGSGQVSLQPTEDPGRWLLLVHGDAELHFDARLFLDPEVRSGLLVGTDLGDVAAGAFWEGRRVARRVLTPLERWDVPVAGLHEAGMLESGLELYAARSRSDLTRLQFASYGGTIVVRQTQ